MTPNAEWKKGAASLAAAGIFALLCILSLLFIDGMEGGFALAFISFFLAVSSVAVSLLFIHRARAMNAILHDPNLLAYWTYSGEMARASAEREYQEFRERNRVMFIIIGGMLAIVALFFIIFVEDGGFETGLFLLAFMGLLFVVSRVMPVIEQRRVMHAPCDAYISRTGIVYEGAVYPFRSFLMYQTGISFRKVGKKGPAVLVFSFTQLVGSFIVRPFDITVPVPAGEEDRAERIIGILGGK